MELREKTGNPCEVETSLYFMVVRQASIEDNPDDDSVQTSLPKSYLRAYHLVPLDSFLCTHGPCTKVDGTLNISPSQTMLCITRWKLPAPAVNPNIFGLW